MARLINRITRLEDAARARPRVTPDFTQISDELLAEIETLTELECSRANAHPNVQQMLAKHGSAPLTDAQMRLFLQAAKENTHAAS